MKKIEKLDYSKQTEVEDTLIEHGPMITKINELIETSNEHNRELIRLHARITELTEDKVGKCPECKGTTWEKEQPLQGLCKTCHGTGVKIVYLRSPAEKVKDTMERCILCNGLGRIKDSMSNTSDCYRLCPQCHGQCNGSGVKDVITDTDGKMKIVDAPKPKSLEHLINDEVIYFHNVTAKQKDNYTIGHYIAIAIRTHIKEIAEGMKKKLKDDYDNGYNQALNDLVERI